MLRGVGKTLVVDRLVRIRRLWFVEWGVLGGGGRRVGQVVGFGVDELCYGEEWFILQEKKTSRSVTWNVKRSGSHGRVFFTFLVETKVADLVAAGGSRIFSVDFNVDILRCCMTRCHGTTLR